MQLYAQQTEIRRSEYRSMDDDGNFINVVQLEIGGRYFYALTKIPIRLFLKGGMAVRTIQNS